MRTTLMYLRARLRERTTWAAIGVAVTGAAALENPFNWIAIMVGVIATLLPSPERPHA